MTPLKSALIPFLFEPCLVVSPPLVSHSVTRIAKTIVSTPKGFLSALRLFIRSLTILETFFAKLETLVVFLLFFRLPSLDLFEYFIEVRLQIVMFFLYLFRLTLIIILFILIFFLLLFIEL